MFASLFIAMYLFWIYRAVQEQYNIIEQHGVCYLGVNWGCGRILVVNYSYYFLEGLRIIGSSAHAVIIHPMEIRAIDDYW